MSIFDKEKQISNYLLETPNIKEELFNDLNFIDFNCEK